MRTETVFGMAAIAVAAYLLLRPKQALAAEPSVPREPTSPPAAGRQTPRVRAERGPRPPGGEMCRPCLSRGRCAEVCQICPDGGWWIRSGASWVCSTPKYGIGAP